MQSDNARSESHQWQLFGLDLSRGGRYLRAGWRELLWGDAAGLRARLDAPVELLAEDGSRHWYVAEQPLASTGLDVQAADYHALLFPSDKVLFRSMRLPKVLELELNDAIALELRTHSPFPANNTVHGWRVAGRAGEFVELSLAIASRSEVMAWLAARNATQKDALPEVWVRDDAGRMLVLEGFGEQQRYKAYPQRIAAAAIKLAFLGLCIVALLALPGVVRSLQSERMEAHFAQAQQEAAEAQALRDALVLGNARVQELQGILDESLDYHALLEQVSRQTPDEVYVQSLRVEGDKLRLAGQASNAVAYMQLLSESPQFVEVQTSSAFSRDRRTGLERFLLDIRVAANTPGEGL